MNKLEQIKNILSPPLKVVEENSETYYIDYSVSMNLMTVIEDIKNGHKDCVTLNTLEGILDKIDKINSILGEETLRKIDKPGHYIVTTNE
jgi:hypothetical protein